MTANERYLAWIATGGTIAGSGTGHTYTAGALPAELLCTRWGLNSPLPLRLITPYQIDSKEATPHHWRRLRDAVAAAIADPACAAVVITHGTDTLEESAALLALTLAPDRPIVLTGAMRPADDPASDGPANWHLASTVALDPTTPPGVYVAFVGALYPALGVRKIATTETAAFAAVAAGRDNLSQPFVPTSAEPARAPLPWPDPWPHVALLPCTALDDPAALTTAVAQGSRGAVLLCPGHGSLPRRWEAPVVDATAQGVAVVRASRCPLGPVLPHPIDASLGTWPAGRLSAAQARVALALVTATADPRTLWYQIAQP